MSLLPDDPSSEHVFRGKRPLDIVPNADELVWKPTITAMPDEWKVYYAGAYLIDLIVEKNKTLRENRRFCMSLEASYLIMNLPRMKLKDRLHLEKYWPSETVESIIGLVKDILVWLTEVGEFNYTQLERWLRQRD